MRFIALALILLGLGSSNMAVAGDSSHQWKLPILDLLSYRTHFSESPYQHAAFMLCNASGRPTCEEADDELSHRFDSEPCRQLYFVALVDGLGSGYGLMQQPFKVVFATKRETGIWPLLVSYPDDDVSMVDCNRIAVAVGR